MDPKLSQLDPKLREAYERVMNGPSAPPSPTNQPAGNMQPQNPLPNTPPATNQTPFNPAPSIGANTNPAPPPPTPIPTPHLNLDEATLPNNPAPVMTNANPAPITPPPAFNANSSVPNNPAPLGNSTISFNAKNAGKNQGMSGAKQKKSVLPIIIGIAIPILLVVYTIIWVIIFEVKIPFLS